MPISSKLETRCDALFDKLVPPEGMASTFEGEMLRAVCRVAYRYRNDGDYFYEGPGCDTAGPSHAFLTSNHCPIAPKLQHLFNKAVGKEDDEYEDALVPIIEAVVAYVEGRAGNYVPNSTDSISCKSRYTYEDSSQDWDYPED